MWNNSSKPDLTDIEKKEAQKYNYESFLNEENVMGETRSTSNRLSRETNQ